MLQIFVFIFVISILTWSMTAFLIEDHKGGTNNEIRYNRQEYSKKVMYEQSYGFLVLSVMLFVSVCILINTLNIGKKKLIGLSSAFSSEANHLICILVFFCSTYILRFVSDRFVLPRLEEVDDLVPCTIEG